MSGELSNALALFEALEKRRTSDERFAELLGEVSTALADILAAMEKPEKPDDDKEEAEALGKAIAAALLVGMKNMPQPTVKVEIPPIKLPDAQSAWKQLDISLKRNGSGSVEGMTLKRIA